MSASNYLEDKILKHVTGKESYSMPTAYLALSSTDPGESGSGITEPVGMGYARVLASGVVWGDPVAGVSSNAVEIEFAVATDNWGTMAYFALFDNITGGNMLVYGAISPSKTITEGDIPLIDIGNLTLEVE